MLSEGKVMGFAPTMDLDAAVAFYRDVLALDMVSRDRFAAVFKSGANNVRVVPVREFTPLPGTTLGWEVDDVAATAR